MTPLHPLLTRALLALVLLGIYNVPCQATEAPSEPALLIACPKSTTLQSVLQREAFALLTSIPGVMPEEPLPLIGKVPPVEWLERLASTGCHNLRLWVWLSPRPECLLMADLPAGHALKVSGLSLAFPGKTLHLSSTRLVIADRPSSIERLKRWNADHAESMTTLRALTPDTAVQAWLPVGAVSSDDTPSLGGLTLRLTPEGTDLVVQALASRQNEPRPLPDIATAAAAVLSELDIDMAVDLASLRSPAPERLRGKTPQPEAPTLWNGVLCILNALSPDLADDTLDTVATIRGWSGLHPHLSFLRHCTGEGRFCLGPTPEDRTAWCFSLGIDQPVDDLASSLARAFPWAEELWPNWQIHPVNAPLPNWRLTNPVLGADLFLGSEAASPGNLMLFPVSAKDSAPGLLRTASALPEEALVQAHLRPTPTFTRFFAPYLRESVIVLPMLGSEQVLVQRTPYQEILVTIRGRHAPALSIFSCLATQGWMNEVLATTLVPTE